MKATVLLRTMTSDLSSLNRGLTTPVGQEFTIPESFVGSSPEPRIARHNIKKIFKLIVLFAILVALYYYGWPLVRGALFAPTVTAVPTAPGAGN